MPNSSKKQKTQTEKTTKDRLLCVMLPTSLLASAKAYSRKVGFNSTSELLRAAMKRALTGALKKDAPEKKAQLSFRLPEALYRSINDAASRTGQSVAKIVRTLLENVSKLAIRPAEIPSLTKKSGTTKTPAKKKSVKAKAPVKIVAKKKSGASAPKKTTASKKRR